MHFTEKTSYRTIKYMKVNLKIITLLATAIVFLMTGCRTSVSTDPITGQQQTAVYQAGYFYATLDADADTAFRTTIHALDRMGMLRTGENHGDDYINIYARQVGDKKVIVRIRQVAPSKSEIRIRAGIAGNLPESQMIYAKIREAL